MQRALIAVGVKKTGGLPELQAAVESAAAVARWATDHQHIPPDRVRLISDEAGRVTRDRIFDVVEEITALGFVEQLIVYFSGHGINAGHYEQWLLSRAPDDPGAAVNVRGSEFNARFCGIGHVVFVSDACRTAADSIQAQGVTGGEIFPNAKPAGPENPVDQFFATLVGNPAYEVRSVAAAAANYRAAYSTVLLEALNGGAPAIIEATPERRLIRPRPLKRHLAVAVPQFLDGLGLSGGQTQQPDARIESDETAWVAELPAALAPTASPGSRGGGPLSPMLGTRPTRPGPFPGSRHADLATAARNSLASALHGRGTPGGGFLGSPTGARGEPGGVSELLQSAARKAVAPIGPDHMETQCGIKVRGARIATAFARVGAAHVGSQQDIVQVSLAPGKAAANVLVGLADGSAVVVPAFRDYLAGLSFDEDGSLADVWYEPSANTALWQEYERAAGELRELRSLVAASSSLGVFRLDGEGDCEALLTRMRMVKAVDPAMAVYAAYALHDHRRRAQIRDMEAYLYSSLHARVFDVAMLSFALAGETTFDGPGAVYPCVPMLTQGWSLLSPLGVHLPERLGRLRGHLRPSLWTHFRRSAAEPLLEALQSGEVG